MRNLIVLLLLLWANAVLASNAHDRHGWWCTGGPPTHYVSTRQPAACADGMECLAACDKGDGEACGFLGRFLEYAVASGNTSIRLAGRYHKLGCEAGWLTACRDFADWLEADGPEEHPNENPLSYLTKACGNGTDIRACSTLAETWTDNERLAESSETAGRYEKKQALTAKKNLGEADRDTPDGGWPVFVGTMLAGRCQSGDSAACRLLAQLTATCGKPDDPGCPIIRETVRMGMQDCENGDAFACLETRNLLFSPMIDPEGLQTRRAYDRAREIFRAQCDTDKDWVNCRNYILSAGQEFRKPEDLDGAEAPRLKNLLERESAFFSSLLSVLCERGELDSCVNLFDRDYSGDELTASALERLNGLCEKGSTETCLRIARVKINPEEKFHDAPGAIALYTRECAKGGCRELARLYTQSPWMAPNKALAIDYLNLGCKSGDAESCRDLAHLEEWLTEGYVRDEE